MYLAIGPVQIILVLLIPIGLFLLGFYLGKKSGYLKKIKEIDKQNKLNN